MKEDIKNIIYEIKDAFKTGRCKYFFHNLSCKLRNWKFQDRKTVIQKIAYSFGVFLISPTGTFYYKMVKIGHYKGGKDTLSKQWEFHPLPWVANYAKKINK